MSLEELKEDWDSLAENVKIEETFSSEQINASLKSKYRSRINRTLLLESLMMSVYIYFMVLIVYRFDVLEKSYLQILGIVSVIVLVLLFVIRMIKLVGIYRWGYLMDSYAEQVQKLAIQKIRIQKFYLLNIIFGFFLLMSLVILNVKIYNEYDVTQNKYFWLISIASSLLFIVIINQWIRNYYTKAIDEAEVLLKELEM